MGHPLRILVPDIVYEVTARTVESRYLLRPSETLRKRIISVIARGAALYDVPVHAFVMLSNHFHLLASSPCGESFKLFLGYIKSNIALECGRAHNWRGRFWDGRAEIIPCVDPAATIGRLRYLISHGAKENLVVSPLEWPGASAVPALVGDMVVRGEWLYRDGLRSARRAAARRQQPVDEQAFVRHIELRLAPLPALATCSADQLRAFHAQLVADVIAETTAVRAGAPVLGAAKVLAQHPHDAAPDSKHSAAPACHATSATTRHQFRKLRSALVTAYRAFSNAAAEVFSPRRRRLLGLAEAAPAGAAGDVVRLSLLKQLPPGMFAWGGWFSPAPPGMFAFADIGGSGVSVLTSGA